MDCILYKHGLALRYAEGLLKDKELIAIVEEMINVPTYTIEEIEVDEVEEARFKPVEVKAHDNYRVDCRYTGPVGLKNVLELRQRGKTNEKFTQRGDGRVNVTSRGADTGTEEDSSCNQDKEKAYLQEVHCKKKSIPSVNLTFIEAGFTD